MIITIDGPAGSGKSTVARKLAARLELPYLDTGAMYRAIAYVACQRNADFSDEPSLVELASGVTLAIDCGPTHTRVTVDGHDVSEAIRGLEVSRRTSMVAKIGAIRDLLVAHQRRIGSSLGSFVSEGRDQGSVVFPSAHIRFVLEASPIKRAERRYQEMVADGEDVGIEAVKENLLARDKIDAIQWEPLLASGQAIVIDTTDLTILQVVDRMIDLIDSQNDR